MAAVEPRARLHLELEIEPDAEAMRLVRGQVRSLMLDGGFCDQGVEMALLGLDEVLMNACTHGGAKKRAEPVELVIDLHADRIVFEVADRGSFQPKNGNGIAKLPDDDSESGRGVFLMQRTMDEVRFEPREGGGTRVRLVKRR